MMSSQDLKKKEKRKEEGIFEENAINSLHQIDHTKTVSITLSEVEKSQKDKAGNNTSSSSKITPYIFYTSDEKARLRWSTDLHNCFVNAVTKLGGPDKATPKTVKETMKVEGIALHHVKSHLQKFRLGKCTIQDGISQNNKRSSIRGFTKTSASSISSRPQVNIKPKILGVKPKKTKEVQGSLYMLIEHDLHLQRCREAQQRQMTFTLENQRNMLNAQSLHQTSRILEQHITPLSFTCVEDCGNDNIACLSLSDFTQHTSNTHSMYNPQHEYTSSVHSPLGMLQFNNTQTQDFIVPYVITPPEPMSSSSTQQQLLFSDNDCVIHDSFRNATFPTTAISLEMDSLHQRVSNNKILFSETPQSTQAYVQHHTYNSYPPYNTLEVVKAQLAAEKNSSTSQIQETSSRESNLSSSITNDEIDPVDKYIDWNKVEKIDHELDPVEVLEALGFGVNS